MKIKKRLCRVALCALLALCINTNLMSQGNTGGTLRSTNGEPLPGATITINRTSRSTVSDSAGQFKIDAPPGSILVVSYAGYTTQELSAGGAVMDIRLQSQTQDLQQVVVIGYQTIRKKDLTGSTGIVNMTDAKQTYNGISR